MGVEGEDKPGLQRTFSKIPSSSLLGYPESKELRDF
jgi:hypothetical protein